VAEPIISMSRNCWVSPYFIATGWSWTGPAGYKNEAKSPVNDFS